MKNVLGIVLNMGVLVLVSNVAEKGTFHPLPSFSYKAMDVRTSKHIFFLR